ncbi:MAG: LemA family protein [Saprospiraceae bacterium]|jgi:LemA protein|nr:LemA family protein [Saprospiraceae bacterium]MDP4700385.1 LemA family protein [Saprospiraceae bacterium]MDP4810731.1 LemA family protein [Saprospiraceae bacterium]MDP4813639.1 LemA family protein [Saprospiraceae bacterium]MDP4915530.1 LemA family protein [Saprospiraceae bacterium]
MKNLTWSVGLIVAGLILLFGGCNTYNSLVNLDEDVENEWGKVQSAYQRRADLIPNLVNTVKGVANFEQTTLTQVVEARAKATSTTIDPSNITPESLKEFQQAQQGLSSSIGRLLMVSENYPELKASNNFLELQAQLEGTENRIKVSRDNFNDVVTTYNKKVRRFPASLFAGIMGFSKRAQFEAADNAQDAPTVTF